MQLHNQTAIITGAGKGIGAATAHALAREGVQLGLVARTAADLEQLQRELTDKYQVKVYFATADIADRSAVERAVATLTEQLGRVD
ncbi:MAG: 3-ketoacyl-ACP reductase, partial [Firmicutes bacterium]|nr:3-ketoacyl-ACP reductase [Bacillota bacterium]